jgi:hypothetical protein
MNQKQIQKDHGKDLYQTIIILVGILTVLRLLNI